MKTWITLGLLKKRVNNKLKYVYILKRGKSNRKRPIFSKSKPEDLKDLLVRKIKNPLTKRINFLHGINYVVQSAAEYCENVMLKEMLEYCRGHDEDVCVRKMRPKFVYHMYRLLTIQNLVSNIHDKKCSEEDLKKECLILSVDVELLDESGITSPCPCSNPIYLHFYNKMKKCLTKDNVLISYKYLKNTQSLRNKRHFFHTVQKCVETLSDNNGKEYT